MAMGAVMLVAVGCGEDSGPDVGATADAGADAVSGAGWSEHCNPSHGEPCRATPSGEPPLTCSVTDSQSGDGYCQYLCLLPSDSDFCAAVSDGGSKCVPSGCAPGPDGGIVCSEWDLCIKPDGV